MSRNFLTRMIQTITGKREYEIATHPFRISAFEAVLRLPKMTLTRFGLAVLVDL